MPQSKIKEELARSFAWWEANAPQCVRRSSMVEEEIQATKHIGLPQ